MTDLILLLQADIDVQSTFERYEDYQEGRGEVFLHQLDAVLTLVRQFPELGRPVEDRYRRLLLRNFPCGVFYANEGPQIVVVAVMDLRQNPETIQRRLTGRPGTQD